MSSTLQPNILYTDTVVSGTALSNHYTQEIYYHQMKSKTFDEEDSVNSM